MSFASDPELDGQWRSLLQTIGGVGAGGSPGGIGGGPGQMGGRGGAMMRGRGSDADAGADAAVTLPTSDVGVDAAWGTQEETACLARTIAHTASGCLDSSV